MNGKQPSFKEAKAAVMKAHERYLTDYARENTPLLAVAEDRYIHAKLEGNENQGTIRAEYKAELAKYLASVAHVKEPGLLVTRMENVADELVYIANLAIERLMPDKAIPQR